MELQIYCLPSAPPNFSEIVGCNVNRSVSSGTHPNTEVWLLRRVWMDVCWSAVKYWHLDNWVRILGEELARYDVFRSQESWPSTWILLSVSAYPVIFWKKNNSGISVESTATPERNYPYSGQSVYWYKAPNLKHRHSGKDNILATWSRHSLCRVFGALFQKNRALAAIDKLRNKSAPNFGPITWRDRS